MFLDITHDSYLSGQKDSKELKNYSIKEGKNKRNRGSRVIRGSYKPRGQCKSAGNSSSSYSSNSSTHPGNNMSNNQKVYINPEVLRRLGYQISSSSSF
jgi:hypothetical protein